MNRPRTVATFLLIVLVFLSLAHFVVYEAIRLSVGNLFPPFALTILLAVAGVSFIVSTFVGRNHYNLFTRAYSWLSMAWIGFFAYLFLASVFYVLEVVLVGDPTRLVALGLFCLIITLTVYGLFHAQSVVIKELDVQLPTLPLAWRGRKAVFVSDLHVGQINGRKFVEKIIQNIQKIAPDVVFIGGDLFDGSVGPRILESIEPFRELVPPHGIYFVLGNHEGYGTAEVFLKKIQEVGIKVLRDEKIFIDGMQILGVDYITTTEKDNFKNVLEKLEIDAGMPSILLKHEPRHVEVAEQAGISFQISGHTHRAQQWPFEFFARMIYGRFAYGLNRIANTWVYTSSGVGTWGPPIRVGTNAEIVVFVFS